MTTDMHKAPSVARNTGSSGESATSVARYDLSTSEGGRRYVSDFFATELRRGWAMAERCWSTNRAAPNGLDANGCMSRRIASSKRLCSLKSLGQSRSFIYEFEARVQRVFLVLSARDLDIFNGRTVRPNIEIDDVLGIQHFAGVTNRLAARVAVQILHFTDLVEMKSLGEPSYLSCKAKPNQLQGTTHG